MNARMLRFKGKKEREPIRSCNTFGEVILSQGLLGEFMHVKLSTYNNYYHTEWHVSDTNEGNTA